MPECQKKISYETRYKMLMKCAKKARGYTKSFKMVKGKQKWTRTLYTGDEVDPVTGRFTSGLETLNGRGLSFDEHIHPESKKKPDYNDWLSSYLARKGRKSEYDKEYDDRVRKPKLADPEYAEEQRRRNRELKRQYYANERKSGILKISGLSSGPDGGRTEEFNLDGIVQEPTPELLSRTKAKFHAVMTEHGGK
jgi:hypothetical protein